MSKIGKNTIQAKSKKQKLQLIQSEITMQEEKQVIIEERQEIVQNQVQNNQKE